MFPILYVYSDIALLVLRLVLGGIFLVHGLPKFTDMKKTAEQFSQMGFVPGYFWGAAIAALEVFGGLLLMVGALVQILAAFFAIMMAVSLVTVGRKKSFVGGNEFELVVLAGSLILLTMGAGMYSLDTFLRPLLG